MDQLNRAVDAVNGGGVIAYPTEAVWGLGCHPWNPKAVNRLLAIKNRPMAKGVILVGASLDQFRPLIDPLTDGERQRLLDSWPGPCTWLIPDPGGWAPPWIRGQYDTVAVRVSDHPLVQALCSVLGHPLVSTSANRAGQPPLLSRQQVIQEFAGAVDYCLAGALGGRLVPSEIRDLKTNRVLRSG